LKPLRQIQIITGNRQSGKTTFLLKTIEALIKSGKTVAGIYANGKFEQNKRSAFYATNICNGEQKLLMKTDASDDENTIGKFKFYPSTFEWGNSIIQKACNSNYDFLVLDEIGRLELMGKGWSSAIDLLLVSNKHLILVIRKEYVEKFIEQNHIQNVLITHVD
jgi:nucleoside-triphosphatase THEP1